MFQLKRMVFCKVKKKANKYVIWAFIASILVYSNGSLHALRNDLKTTKTFPMSTHNIRFA